MHEITDLRGDWVVPDVGCPAVGGQAAGEGAKSKAQAAKDKAAAQKQEQDAKRAEAKRLAAEEEKEMAKLAKKGGASKQPVAPKV